MIEESNLFTTYLTFAVDLEIYIYKLVVICYYACKCSCLNCVAVVRVHWRWYSVYVVATPNADASGPAKILCEGNVRWSDISAQ